MDGALFEEAEFAEFNVSPRRRQGLLRVSVAKRRAAGAGFRVALVLPDKFSRPVSRRLIQPLSDAVAILQPHAPRRIQVEQESGAGGVDPQPRSARTAARVAPGEC